MTEEEIIKYIKDEIENDKDTARWFEEGHPTRKQIEEGINVYQGLLDLYNKEKEKNIELLEKLEMKKLLFVRKDHITNGILCEYYIREDEIEKDYISKDKIRELLEDVNETLEYTKNNDLVDTIFFINGVKNSLEKLLEENKKW